VVMSFTCVFLPFYIKVYYCEMFGFFLAFFGGVFGFFMFWQSGNPACMGLSGYRVCDRAAYLTSSVE